MHKYTSNNSGERTKRRRKILEMVGMSAIETQEQLVKGLRKAGYRCTQASVSRDVADLQLVKRGGRYHASDEAQAVHDPGEFARSVRGFVERAEAVGEHMVVVKAVPGMAHSVAEFLDRSGWDGLAGTVAGDNTVFVAVRNSAASRKIIHGLREIMGE